MPVTVNAMIPVNQGNGLNMDNSKANRLDAPNENHRDFGSILSEAREVKNDKREEIKDEDVNPQSTDAKANPLQTSDEKVQQNVQTNSQKVESNANAFTGSGSKANPFKLPDSDYIVSANLKTSGTESEPMAGPRVDPNAQKAYQSSANEEAKSSEANREALKNVNRPIDWFNDVFRKPVNDLTRDGWRFPSTSNLNKNAQSLSGDNTGYKVEIKANQNAQQMNSDSSGKQNNSADFALKMDNHSNLQTQQVGKSFADLELGGKLEISGSNNALDSLGKVDNQIASHNANVFQIKEPIDVPVNTHIRLASEVHNAASDIPEVGGRMTLKVALNPPKLGPLQIEITRHESGIDVKLITKSDLATEFFNERVGEFRQAILDHGVNLRKFEVIGTNERTLFAQDNTLANQGGSAFNRGGEEYQESWGFPNTSDDHLKDVMEKEEMNGSMMEVRHQGLDILA